MSDSRAIGIFDSGLGGLTVAKEIYRELPAESTIYMGDTARVPYGNRSPEMVIGFSRQIVRFLIAKDVKAIVIACATASSVALETLQQEFPTVPLYGVIHAAAIDAVNQSQTGHIGLIGTRATINSGSFQRALTGHPNSLVTAIACPLFVPIIEEGMLDGPILESVIQTYLEPLKVNSVDTLVLGCTHYPLISSAIHTYLPSTTLINVGRSLAQTIAADLAAQQLTNGDHPPTHTYFATDVTENFTRVASLFLGASLTIQPQRVEDLPTHV